MLRFDGFDSAGLGSEVGCQMDAMRQMLAQQSIGVFAEFVKDFELCTKSITDSMRHLHPESLQSIRQPLQDLAKQLTPQVGIDFAKLGDSTLAWLRDWGDSQGLSRHLSDIASLNFQIPQIAPPPFHIRNFFDSPEPSDIESEPERPARFVHGDDRGKAPPTRKRPARFIHDDE